MKWFITIWILISGLGVSYSVIRERMCLLQRMRELEQSLNRLIYYMCQWRMPVKEALGQSAKEEIPWLQEFYLQILHMLNEHQSEDFGVLWQTEGEKLMCLPEKIRSLFSKCFLQIPMEPEALKRRITERTEEIASYTKELQEKYKGEQRLVFTMGIFAGAFLCLILW